MSTAEQEPVTPSNEIVTARELFTGAESHIVQPGISTGETAGISSLLIRVIQTTANENRNGVTTDSLLPEGPSYRPGDPVAEPDFLDF